MGWWPWNSSSTKVYHREKSVCGNIFDTAFMKLFLIHLILVSLVSTKSSYILEQTCSWKHYSKEMWSKKIFSTRCSIWGGLIEKLLCQQRTCRREETFFISFFSFTFKTAVCINKDIKKNRPNGYRSAFSVGVWAKGVNKENKIDRIDLKGTLMQIWKPLYMFVLI